MMPLVSDIPADIRQQMIERILIYQNGSDKWYSLLNDVYILEREAKEHNLVMVAKTALDIFNEFLGWDERFGVIAKLALKAHPFKEFQDASQA